MSAEEVCFMEELSLYKKAHLIVAAIRVLSHQNSRAPSVDDICHCLDASAEHTHMMCRRLEEKNIIEAVESVDGVRLFVQNHEAIEQLEDDLPKSGIEDELEQFKKDQLQRDKKINDIKNREAERKKKLFEQLEEGLKKEINK